MASLNEVTRTGATYPALGTGSPIVAVYGTPGTDHRKVRGCILVDATVSHEFRRHSLQEAEGLAGGLTQNKLEIFDNSGHYSLAREKAKFLCVVRDWLKSIEKKGST